MDKGGRIASPCRRRLNDAAINLWGHLPFAILDWRFIIDDGGRTTEDGVNIESVPSEAVPKDPFDDKELRYKKLETGFVVYSIGEDGNDDGGKERPRPPPGPPARQMLLS